MTQYHDSIGDLGGHILLITALLKKAFSIKAKEWCPENGLRRFNRVFRLEPDIAILYRFVLQNEKKCVLKLGPRLNFSSSILHNFLSKDISRAPNNVDLIYLDIAMIMYPTCPYSYPEIAITSS